MAFTEGKYQQDLEAFLAEPGEPGLAAAYGQGRSALENGIGLVAFAQIHADAQSRAGGEGRRGPNGALSGQFFAEGLAAYEMAFRRYQEDLITSRGETSEARAEAEIRLRVFDEVFDHAPIGMAKVDARLKILAANDPLYLIMRVPPGSLGDHFIYEFLEPDVLADTLNHLQPLLNSTANRTELTIPLRRGDGAQSWVHWTATAVHGADGAIAYLLIMLEDITARREVEMAAAASLAALERLDGLKSEFVAVVSHEFRTALVGIQGFSEIMRDETLSDAEVREYATDINIDALRLSRMITEMLDLDRIESGRMTLHLSQVDMLDLVTAAVERARASTSNHTISVRCEQRPPRFSGDSDRLSQVLTNILSNAIKYSPKGGDITVSLGSNATGLSIAIQDQGLGIPADFLGRVFDRYERYESSAADRIIGTGLGLPIAHQIVEMHGGSITVASPEGHGTVFTIHLPFAH